MHPGAPLPTSTVLYLLRLASKGEDCGWHVCEWAGRTIQVEVGGTKEETEGRAALGKEKGFVLKICKLSPLLLRLLHFVRPSKIRHTSYKGRQQQDLGAAVERGERAGRACKTTRGATSTHRFSMVPRTKNFGGRCGRKMQDDAKAREAEKKKASGNKCNPLAFRVSFFVLPPNVCTLKRRN